MPHTRIVALTLLVATGCLASRDSHEPSQEALDGDPSSAPSARCDAFFAGAADAAASRAALVSELLGEEYLFEERPFAPGVDHDVRVQWQDPPAQWSFPAPLFDCDAQRPPYVDEVERINEAAFAATMDRARSLDSARASGVYLQGARILLAMDQTYLFDALMLGSLAGPTTFEDNVHYGEDAFETALGSDESCDPGAIDRAWSTAMVQPPREFSLCPPGHSDSDEWRAALRLGIDSAAAAARARLASRCGCEMVVDDPLPLPLP